MSNNFSKRFGLILIILGIFFPSFLYPFTSLTWDARVRQALFASKGATYNPRFDELENVFKEGVKVKSEDKYHQEYIGRIALPYRYTLASGVALIFIGIGFIVLGQKKVKSNIYKITPP